MTGGLDFGENVSGARAALLAAGRSGFISDRPDDVAYLVGPRAFIYRVMAEGRGFETVVLTATELMFFTAPAYLGYYRRVGVAARSNAELAGALSELAAQDERGISVPTEVSGRLGRLAAEIFGPDRASRDDPVARRRRVKHPEELARIRAAAAAADAGMAAAIAGARPGQRELDAAGEAERAMRASGAEAFAFSTIVSSGPELGVMREVTSTRRLATGDWVMVDLGCAIAGYHAEFARSFELGPPTPDYVAAYHAVQDAQAKAIELVRPGAPVRAVHEVAHDVLDRAGYGAVAYQHLTGHGIGTAVWEEPFIGAEADDTFEAGMVVCIEPGVFIPDQGGIRIEDVVLVTLDGHERLTRTPLLAGLV